MNIILYQTFSQKIYAFEGCKGKKYDSWRALLDKFDFIYSSRTHRNLNIKRRSLAVPFNLVSQQAFQNLVGWFWCPSCSSARCPPFMKAFRLIIFPLATEMLEGCQSLALHCRQWVEALTFFWNECFPEFTIGYLKIKVRFWNLEFRNENEKIPIFLIHLPLRLNEARINLNLGFWLDPSKIFISNIYLIIWI